MQGRRPSSLNGAHGNGTGSEAAIAHPKTPVDIEDRVVSLYAGVGIVKGSFAESEWQVDLVLFLNT